MATFIDKNGQRQEVNLNGMALYKEAMKKGLSVRQLINQKYPTVAGGPDTFQQMCIAAGLRFKRDDNFGIPAANLMDILDPHVPDNKEAGNSFIPADAIPDSRILFPAALMEVIEDKLQSKEDVATAAFESLIGNRVTVATNKVEQPVISYSGAKGPEDSQAQRISQNTRPPIMLSLTASDISRKIPTYSIGMEMSYEALQSNSLDFVAMTMARFLKMSTYNEWITQIGLILSGDPDGVTTSMDTGTAALATTKANTYDTALAGLTGVISQKAYLAWLYNRSMSMTKTHMVCDFNAAMAIEERDGRPTVMHNNASTDRLDAPYQVVYPAFQRDIKMIVMPSGTFSAHTIMGLEQSTALTKITSSVSTFSAIEDIVMKKSRELRMDYGFLIYRNYSTSFDCLTLLP